MRLRSTCAVLPDARQGRERAGAGVLQALHDQSLCLQLRPQPFQILAALDPRHAFAFATSHGAASFIVLGSVLLAITGAEALYADLGHFGRRAIRVAWFGAAAPALVLNYFGQGALLITHPEAIANPFYLAFPAWALYPMIVLATAATVPASSTRSSIAW